MLLFVNNAMALDVYYFYKKPRCMTCQKIEKYTKEAVTSMNDKDVKFIGIDLDNSANQSYIKKYNLYTKSVIITDTKNEKEQWKNLDKIWTKTNNEKDFKNYIVSELNKMKIYKISVSFFIT